MSLVPDYDSDSELESEKIEKISIKPKKRKRIIAVDEINSAIETKAGIDTDTETKDSKKTKISIASFLPTPKNRKGQPKGLTNQHGNNKVETKDTDVEINDTQVKTYTNVETNDTQATTNDDESDEISTEPTTVPSLFSFEPVANSRPKLAPVGPMKPDLPSLNQQPISQPIVETVDQPIIQDTPQPPPNKRTNNNPYQLPSDIDSLPIIDFNVDQFYKSNMDAQGGAANMATHQINRPVRAVASGKHQLSSLIRSAYENRDGLEEMFAANRKTKKDIGSKYGFQ